jgi:hypothetical protein
MLLLYDDGGGGGDARARERERCNIIISHTPLMPLIDGHHLVFDLLWAFGNWV